MDTPHGVDADFLALPLDEWADAALGLGAELGATHVQFRTHRLREAQVSLYDGDVEASTTSEDLGLSVRVVHDGAWGFAAGDDLTTDGVVALVRQAVGLARTARPLARLRVELADEPGYGSVEHVSRYVIDPLTTPPARIEDRLAALSRTLLAHRIVDHVKADCESVKETSFIATSDGTRARQQRVRIAPSFTALAVTDAGFESLRTLAPCTGRGLEYLEGNGWDWEAEIAELPDLLAEKVAAPSVEPGRYDLLIDPTNLWLTIHESVGHATELDRALGDEANYAGTSFATPDHLGSLQYGSALMTIVADRTQEHGLATTGWDDEGVATQEWNLVEDGVLVDYQTDRYSASRQGLGRSRGCAYADSAQHTPLQRMANVSLAPDPAGADMQGMLDALGDGILILGDGSWSIDMQRYNFQFTGQRFHRVVGGRIVGQLRDVVYQGRTPDFWGSLDAIGGPSTYKTMGAFNCGKGQPGQVAAVSHGAPASVFRSINVLNAGREGSA